MSTWDSQCCDQQQSVRQTPPNVESNLPASLQHALMAEYGWTPSKILRVYHRFHSQDHLCHPCLNMSNCTQTLCSTRPLTHPVWVFFLYGLSRLETRRSHDESIFRHSSHCTSNSVQASTIVPCSISWNIALNISKTKRQAHHPHSCMCANVFETSLYKSCAQDPWISKLLFFGHVHLLKGKGLTRLSQRRITSNRIDKAKIHNKYNVNLRLAGLGSGFCWHMAPNQMQLLAARCKQDFTRHLSPTVLSYSTSWSLEVKLPTICRDGKAEVGRVREEKSRSEKIREEKEWEARRCRCSKKVGTSRFIVFFQWFGAPEGRKVTSLKRRVRSQLARWKMKNCTPLWREAHFEVKMYKPHQRRATFGSWDVEKVHADVARSTFPSQHVQNTPTSDHFLTFRCRKKCTPLWREAHFQVKSVNKLQVLRLFWRSDVEKVDTE